MADSVTIPLLDDAELLAAQPTSTSVPTPYDKRLMVFAGRGSQELGSRSRRSWGSRWAGWS